MASNAPNYFTTATVVARPTQYSNVYPFQTFYSAYRAPAYQPPVHPTTVSLPQMLPYTDNNSFYEGGSRSSFVHHNHQLLAQPINAMIRPATHVSPQTNRSLAHSRTSSQETRHRNSSGNRQLRLITSTHLVSNAMVGGLRRTATSPVVTSARISSRPASTESFETSTVENQLCCAVCLESYISLLRQNMRPVALNTCCHAFCERCMQSILGQRAKCPKCRKPIDIRDPYHVIYF